MRNGVKQRSKILNTMQIDEDYRWHIQIFWSKKNLSIAPPLLNVNSVQISNQLTMVVQKTTQVEGDKDVTHLMCHKEAESSPKLKQWAKKTDLKNNIKHAFITWIHHNPRHKLKCTSCLTSKIRPSSLGFFFIKFFWKWEWFLKMGMIESGVLGDPKRFSFFLWNRFLSVNLVLSCSCEQWKTF